jgi:hypothetical protein
MKEMKEIKKCKRYNLMIKLFNKITQKIKNDNLFDPVKNKILIWLKYE